MNIKRTLNTSQVTKMKNYKKAPITLLSLGLLLSALQATGARATDVTLTISNPVAPVGSLSISTPPTFSYGTTIANSTLIKQMGPVTVTDDRGGTTGWIVSVIASALTNQSPPANTIIPTAMSYSSGLFLKTGTGILVEQDQTDLTGELSVVTETSTVGIMTATWNPTMTLVIPAGASEGTYTGTITQSVA